MDLPLFPLNTVLLPGGRLPLRIFEPRYLDMVRSCMREGSGFGVCLIRDGQEAGRPATPARFGTEARIVDFDTLDGGLLGITAEGGARIRVDALRVTKAGLTIGSVERLPADPSLPVPAQHALLATLLRRLADHGDPALAAASDAEFDEAAWVGHRLAERIPVTLAERQQFLEIDDPIDRLDLLALWLPRFQRD